MVTLFLLIFAKTQWGHFWHLFSKNFKNWISKIFGGPQALGKNGKKWKKNFFDETQNLKSLWSKDCTHKIWMKSETNFFFCFKGGTLWCFSDFQSLNKQTLIKFEGHEWRDRLIWMLKYWCRWMSKCPKFYLKQVWMLAWPFAGL